MFYSCKPGEELVIERFGRYHKTVSQPGMGLKGLFDRVAVRVNVMETKVHINAQIKTSDCIFAEMPVSAAVRICDSKKYHYGALDGMSQLGVLLNMSIRHEAAALTAAQAMDSSAVLDRILAEKHDMLRDTYGIELISLTQQGLNLPNLSIPAFALTCPPDRAQEGSDASRAMQQGLESDVQIRKPLSFKKGGAASVSG
jgi:regulator of protease activity HflC (stomatin/prohibitin superfamily)